MEQKIEQSTNPYRRMLVAAISTVLLELGADSAESEVLETLTEMLQCFLVEVGNISRNYYELSGRTEPLIADVILAFVEMGIDFTRLSHYAKVAKHAVLPQLQAQAQPKQLNMLQAGVKHSLPSFIPPHLPPFPDPHAYIRTPTHKQPVIDYEAIREKYAAQKRDVEKALTKFLARTSHTHNLFDNDEFIFPLISVKQPQYAPYLAALLPQDQIFDPEELEYKVEELKTPPKKRVKTDSDQEKQAKEEPDDMDDDDEEQEAEKMEKSNTQQSIADIDNPYLAPPKLPPQNPRKMEVH